MRTQTLMVVAVAMVTLLAGCETSSPYVDKRFGEATMALKAQQTKDPAATLKNENRPVDGLEGRAASNAVEQYYKSFAKENTQPMTILNLGVSGSSGN